MEDLLSTPTKTQEEFRPDNPLAEIEEQSNEIAELSKKGYQLLKENNITEAEAAFNQILSLEDNNNYALVGLGDSARKQNHFHDAIDFYSRCLTYHPGNNYALFGLADCYKALNQFHKAISIIVN